jgi:hypothetical protein
MKYDRRVRSDSRIVINVQGRPSPWANQPHEGAWRHLIAIEARRIKADPFHPSVRPSRVIIEFRMIESRRGDLDNLAKPVLDTLFRQSRSSKFPVSSLFCCDDFHLPELILRRVIVHSPELEGANIVIDLEVPEEITFISGS